jgi:hypothetical protein
MEAGLLDNERRILRRVYELWKLQSQRRFNDRQLSKDLNIELQEVTDHLKDFVSETMFHLEHNTNTTGYAVRLVPKGMKFISRLFQQASLRENDLNSERDIDYTRLRDLLKTGLWEEADQETSHRMLEAVGQDRNGWMRPEELQNFPCTDLVTIDRLWVKYSQSKWGFTVQKQIYVDCGGQLDYKYPGDKIWHEFCTRVGWSKNSGEYRGGEKYLGYSELIFDLEKSPVGEFPVFWKRVVGGLIWGDGMWGERWGGALLSRIAICEL